MTRLGSPRLRVAAVQAAPVLGDPATNAAAISEIYAQVRGRIDLLVLPELFLCGYPPDDLLYRTDLIEACEAAVEKLAGLTINGPAVLVGTPVVGPAGVSVDAAPRILRNTAVLLAEGRVAGSYAKRRLPNYGPFDEARYFTPGDQPGLFQVPTSSGEPMAVSVVICEDLWDAHLPVYDADTPGEVPKLVISLNASPFHAGKQAVREHITSARASDLSIPVLYVAQSGGVDEFVFDGGTHIVGANGQTITRAPAFNNHLLFVEVAADGSVASEQQPSEWPGPELEVYQALTTGLASYVSATQAPLVFIGLSGGIDSALTAVVAVDALGADKVVGVTMPGPYSSEGSVSDSKALAERLGIECITLPIVEAYQVLDQVYGKHVEGWGEEPTNVAHQNLQARLRGMSLMALANQRGGLVLATGNKSEMSVGYATLYGDMVGGYAVLKDVYKTDVYKLSEWRQNNQPHPDGVGAPFPSDTLTKPPSAELAPGQLDTDSLPPYEILDQILRLYVDADWAPETVAAKLDLGEDQVWQVVDRVDRNEFKRRQAPLGIRVSEKSLGRDRRLPISARHARLTNPDEVRPVEAPMREVS